MSSSALWWLYILGTGGIILVIILLLFVPRIHGLVKKGKTHKHKKSHKNALTLSVVFAPLCTVLAALIASLGVFAGLGLTVDKQATDNTNALNEQYTTALAGLTSGDATVRAGSISNLEIIADNWSTWPDLQKSDREIQIKAIINTLIAYLHRPIPQDSDGVYDEAEKYIRDSIAGIFQRRLVPASSNDDQPEPSDRPTQVSSVTVLGSSAAASTDNACIMPSSVTYSLGQWSNYALDFSHTYWNSLDLRHAVFTTKLSFSNADFLGDVHLGDVTFVDEATFDSVTFHSDVEFSGSTFAFPAEYSPDFSFARFFNSASFYKTVFRGGPNYSEASFSGRTDWTDAVFGAWTNFIAVAFTGYSNVFTSSHFCQDVDFSFSNFSYSSMSMSNEIVTLFQSTYFDGKVDFSYATFFSSGVSGCRTAEFSDSIFSGEVDFTHSSFAGDGVSFESAIFLNDVDFRDSIVYGPTDIKVGMYAGILDNCGLEFVNAQFSTSIFLGGLSLAQGCMSLAHVTGLQGTVTLSEGTQIAMPNGTTHLASEGSTVSFP